MSRQKRSREKQEPKNDDEVQVIRIVKPNPLRKPKMVKIYVKDEPKEFWATKWANPEEPAPETKRDRNDRRNEKRRKKEKEEKRDIEEKEDTDHEKEGRKGKEREKKEKNDWRSLFETFPAPSIYGPFYRPLSWSFRGPDKDRYYY